ncbi:MAG: hypothetical protein F4X59_17485 [Holophagales bacterium]|nr:hypothetical protein [Holophagales bacterium]MYC11899.1 hypothetical protein [Holophagales bacterium]
MALSKDGARRIVGAAQLQTNADGTSLIAGPMKLGFTLRMDPALSDDFRIAHFSHQFRITYSSDEGASPVGGYMTYQAGNPVRTPVNQNSYLFEKEHGAWMVHACTFAHHVIANHNERDLHLLDPALLRAEPSARLRDDHALRDQLAVVYAKVMIGYAFDEFEKFEKLAAQPATDATDAQKWSVQLDRLRALDALICDECGSNHHWVRDFKASMVPIAWRYTIDGQPKEIANTTPTKYRVALPKIDKVGSTDGWTPSGTPPADVFSFENTNKQTLLDSDYYGFYAGRFRDAVRRWDRDARARAAA